MKTKDGLSKLQGQDHASTYKLSKREMASLMSEALSKSNEHGEYLWPYGRRIGTPMSPATVARKIAAIRRAESAGISPLVYPREYRRLSTAKAPGEIWAMDCIADALADGQRIRILPIIVASTEECMHIEVGVTLTGVQVAHALEQVRRHGRLPKLIRVGHGPAPVDKALLAWAQQHNVILQFRCPNYRVWRADNLSFYSRLRKECLDQHAFRSVDDARKQIETWRTDYNSDRA